MVAGIAFLVMFVADAALGVALWRRPGWRLPAGLMAAPLVVIPLLVVAGVMDTPAMWPGSPSQSAVTDE